MMELNQCNHTDIMKEAVHKLSACSAVPLSYPTLSYSLPPFPLFLLPPLYELWCISSLTVLLFSSLTWQIFTCSFCWTNELHWFSKLSYEQQQASLCRGGGRNGKLHCHCVQLPHQRGLELPYIIRNSKMLFIPCTE